MNGRKTKELRKKFAKLYDANHFGAREYRRLWRRTKRLYARGLIN